MNMSFLVAGSSSSNPVLFTLAIGLILAWKVAGYYGVDRYLLPMLAPVASGQGDRAKLAIGRRPNQLTEARLPARSTRCTTPVDDGRGRRMSGVYRPSPPEGPRRLVGGGPLLVGHELEAVVARVMRVAIEPTAEVLEALDLAAGDGLEARRDPAFSQSAQEVVQAERGLGEGCAQAGSLERSANRASAVSTAVVALRTGDAGRPLRAGGSRTRIAPRAIRCRRARGRCGGR